MEMRCKEAERGVNVHRLARRRQDELVSSQVGHAAGGRTLSRLAGSVTKGERRGANVTGFA